MTEWKLLASSEDGFGISRCPGGHIHVELEEGEFTLRFDENRFLAFARTVSMAAAAVAGPRCVSSMEFHRDGRLSLN